MNDITCPICGHKFVPEEGKNKWNQRIFNRIIAQCPSCKYKGPYNAFLKSPEIDLAALINNIPTRSQGAGIKMSPQMFGIDPMMQETPTSLVASKRGKFIRKSILEMLD